MRQMQSIAGAWQRRSVCVKVFACSSTMDSRLQTSQSRLVQASWQRQAGAQWRYFRRSKPPAPIALPRPPSPTRCTLYAFPLYIIACLVCNIMSSVSICHVLQELADVLQEIDCVHISMNPVTVPNIVKALSRIVDAEGLTTAPDMVQKLYTATMQRRPPFWASKRRYCAGAQHSRGGAGRPVQRD